MNKKCIKCNQFKSIDEFTIDKKRKDGIHVYCKKCLSNYQKLYRLKNKQKLLAQAKKSYYKYQQKHSIRKQKFKQKYPWACTLQYIKARCNNPNKENFKYYGGRGIECRITKEELKELWFRDKAYLMKKPSIDRKDENGHYEFDNCRYIELKDNTIARNKKSVKPILQYDLNGNFIKEFESIYKASIEINRQITNICSALSGKINTCAGFIWRYK